MSIAWMLCASALASPDAEELTLPDDLEVPSRTSDRRADSVQARAADRGLAVLVGLSRWRARGGQLAVRSTWPLTPVASWSVEGGGMGLLVLRPRSSQRVTAILPVVATGIELRTPMEHRLRPMGSLEGTLTLFRSQPLIGVAPGVRARAGGVLELTESVGLLAEGSLGVAIAPGLSRDVNAVWSDDVVSLGLRVGLEVRR